MKPSILLTAAFLIGGALVISTVLRPSVPSHLSSIPCTCADLRPAILHYATSSSVPLQTISEIRLTYDVLRAISPCNLLVFGLGHDSIMWSSFNPSGTTVFLEDSPNWTQSVLESAPDLTAHTVRYTTHVSDADRLLESYKSEPSCLPPHAYLKGNHRCPLALPDLPSSIYDREWDLIMIDAPKGYFNEAPGRMSPIWSAAVMARARTRAGDTHVFLHNVDRKIEEGFAMEFLCKKYLVGEAGRIWHFKIPPAKDGRSTRFC
ncbi:hypothetical protein J5N97_007200 [Dioscorea zingiberensis]|uniref:Polysaccharide biosynthesis domain-containing protein n=1 Tax=Dioscorea zingiberensis TaxID=325984 RepID=A0A9D5DC58_9LILI|nr:hypothetical protein J5N97_007200 [Dioscorea zingiberensis]